MRTQSYVDKNGALLELGRHRLRIDPRRSMKAITGEVEALLEGFDEASRSAGALMASELIAQVVGRDPGWLNESVGLTVQLREDAVRMEATGPVAPSIGVRSDHHSPPDPLAAWGPFILDRLADRWGVDEDPQRGLWAEIRRRP